jgi:branched-chain amino acid transport system ATP-binding protein
MCAIGRALMASPRLLLLDEPSLGLAPLVVRQIYGVLPAIRQGGVTILIVEQNIKEVLRLADRAYVLENGRVVLSGPSERVREDERLKRAYLGI